MFKLEAGWVCVKDEQLGFFFPLSIVNRKTKEFFLRFKL